MVARDRTADRPEGCGMKEPSGISVRYRTKGTKDWIPKSPNGAISAVPHKGKRSWTLQEATEWAEEATTQSREVMLYVWYQRDDIDQREAA